jgi:UDP-glucose 4-epimerase
MGKIPVPTPRVALDALRQVGSIGADFSSEQIRFLTYGRVLDTTAARDILGFACEYSTVEAFDDFARQAGSS